MILENDLFLFLSEETMPTPELVDGIIFVVKAAEVAEGQLLLNPGGQQTELKQTEEQHRDKEKTFRHVDRLLKNTSLMVRKLESYNCLLWSLLWKKLLVI